MSGRLPHYSVNLKHVDEERGTRIGAAWVNETRKGDKYLSLSINVPVLLTKDYKLTLFKIDDREHYAAKRASQEQQETDGVARGDGDNGNYADDFDGDDIPFATNTVESGWDPAERSKKVYRGVF